MSKVYYLSSKNMTDTVALSELLSPFRKSTDVSKNDMTAVKIHPGEENNSSFVTAQEVNAITKALDLKLPGAFLTDTTVLYPGRRRTAPDCIALAREHGFGYPDTLPFIIADGLRGNSETLIPPPANCSGSGKFCLAPIICNADNMVVISHFKGHLLSGFGGAVKNLGMGCATRRGKFEMHSSVTPFLRKDKCTACGICIEYCPEDAITVDNLARIDSSKCIGCGECLGICPTGAWRISWNREMNTFMRRMAEYAYCVTTVTKPFVYINFITKVVPDCDCLADSGNPFVDDIGITVSSDPVALDRASLDLVTAAPSAGDSPIEKRAGAGDDKFKVFRPEIDGMMHLEIAESLGLGTTKYNLIKV